MIPFEVLFSVDGVTAQFTMEFVSYDEYEARIGAELFAKKTGCVVLSVNQIANEE